MRRSVWVLSLLAACAACSSSAQPVPPQTASWPPADVLFVGNSFTYYNNSLHNQYRKLVRAARGAEWQGLVRCMVISGGRMREHREGLRQRLAEQSFDAVVLQGHSIEPLTNEPEFRAAVTEHANGIRAHGGVPVLLMTWAYEGRPAMTQRLAAAYSSIGRELDVTVVPVGLAFARVTTERPDLALRVGDGKHPTPVGTYLAACTMFAALHEQSPIGLAYTAGLPETVASYLQRAAWQALQERGVR